MQTAVQNGWFLFFKPRKSGERNPWPFIAFRYFSLLSCKEKAALGAHLFAKCFSSQGVVIMWLVKHSCHHPRRTWVVLCHRNATCIKIVLNKECAHICYSELLVSVPLFSKATAPLCCRQASSIKVLTSPAQLLLLEWSSTDLIIKLYYAFAVLIQVTVLFPRCTLNRLRFFFFLDGCDAFFYWLRKKFKLKCVWSDRPC